MRAHLARGGDWGAGLAEGRAVRPARQRARLAARVAGLCGGLLCAGFLPMVASAASLSAQYDISLIGLKIGTATVKGDFAQDRYKLEIWAKLTGLVGAVTGGKGAASATGSLGGARPVPSSFAVTTATSDKSAMVRMALAAGTVQAVEIKPLPEPKADRVALTEAHKRGVVDPVSALIMPAQGAGSASDPAACNRTIPVFDGAARFDVVLTYSRTEMVKGPAYDGPVLVCAARYVPIAGHRPNRPANKFMEENRDMETWLAPVDGARLFMPFRISVRTMLGTTVIEASHFAVNGREGRAPDKPVRAQN
ncbi:DUF3108 domain-containing protein [Chelatococcus sp. SYSU_G07232]|uniref:DUF3108 domain-containing protein n=1 Tax=Chelatococcus albus TaxID=3047466 RepID=A0ABT7ADI1_9HYPH|nr:DUF3108 domain-containing protein [Chelatococcus sp. SYSU_G07232]MDJ1157403.1 DUF3108 domain-containing protein [Chelatococcus sp. SYSU_G07232]